MNIQQTIDFLENLKNISEKKCEKKLYTLFSEILRSIDSLKLTEDMSKKISEKLTELEIDSIQEKQYKYIKKQYIAFTQYLETEHKLIEK
jgi:predicted RNase H-like nuclease